MSEHPRRKSPRAPSISLAEAMERAGKAYDRDKLDARPADVVAKSMGYQGASSGTALRAMASLRYFGLLERPRDGVLAVAKDYENYRFAPDDATRRSLLQKFLLSPPLFRELLDRYPETFPPDATLRYELLQRGFLPATAAALLVVLRRSIEFAGEPASAPVAPVAADPGAPPTGAVAPPAAAADASPLPDPADSPLSPHTKPAAAYDRIPVRLSGARRAWLEVPEPFYEADKKRLKAQIDLLLTEDGDEGGIP